MPVFDLKCNKCDIMKVDVWLKAEQLPTSEKSETACAFCEGGLMFRTFGNTPYHWKAGEYGGDASRVRRFEFISKDVETVDVKATQRNGGRITLDKSR